MMVILTFLISQLLMRAFMATAIIQPAAPDFVIVGTMKGGTTALRYNLDKHPNIFIPEKEVHHYDDTRFEVGPKQDPTEYYYKSLYELAVKSSKKDIKIIGTGSPRYNVFSEVPYLMYADNPKTKIIFCIRDPVDRALSSYIMGCATQNLSPSNEKFEEKIRSLLVDKYSYKLVDYKRTGMHRSTGSFAEAFYILPILRFSNVFGRENIHVVCNENTKGEGGKYSYYEVFDFLEVPRQDVELSNYFEGSYSNVSVSKTLRADMNKVFQPWNDELIAWLKATEHKTAQDTNRLVKCVQSWATL